MCEIASNLAAINDEVASFCKKLDRDPASVTLVAVSKTKPMSAIEAAYQSGQRHFAENYLQDALSKIVDSNHTDIQWHFVGAIQSNKTNAIADHFHWIHSIDRLKIAQRIGRRRIEQKLPPMNVCIQVNISEELQKSGVAPKDALSFATDVAGIDGIQLRGLMAVAEAAEASTIGAQFAAMEVLTNKLKQIHPTIDTLSMGMSQDWPIALEYGATMIRVGTAIFGARTK